MDNNNILSDLDFVKACCIGDGHLGHHRTWYSLVISHCNGQFDYLAYKARRINAALGSAGKVRSFDNNGYPGQRFAAGNSKILEPIYHDLYENGRKRVAKSSLLNNLSPEGLAVWWMDDGSCTEKWSKTGKVKGYIGYLHTYESEGDNQLIVESLNSRFNLNLKSVPDKGKFRIYLNTSDLRDLKDIIIPYVLPSLAYKIRVSDRKIIGYRA
jgi:hypothetical protein